MRQIKTITQPIDKAAEFDDEVNAALADGWRLQHRQTMSFRGSFVFIAYMDKNDRDPLEAKEEDEAQGDDREEATETYKGFLYIRCDKCGTDKGFYTKNPIRRFRCDCGHFTPLHNLAHVNASCECGQAWTYRTNILDRTFSINCLECGTPIDLELHPRDNAYITMR